eukprot:Nitzschia sp. Nitz4//scaffold22_size323478//226213//226392//NITZ4_000564-RA/size323478-exonerate_protein2genome-gene-0.50-mRNA-1//1//CDS//3329543106//3133//frame0
MRPKVLAEYPGIKFVDLGKVMGERWQALSPAQEKEYEDISVRSIPNSAGRNSSSNAFSS